MLQTCDAIIGAAIDQARQAKQEPGVVEMVLKIDTNGGNLNICAPEESQLAATKAELETMLGKGGGAMLETGAVRFSKRSDESW